MANELQALADTKEVCLMNYSLHIFSLKRRNCSILQGKYSLLILWAKGIDCQKPENKNVICNAITIKHLELEERFTSYSSEVKHLNDLDIDIYSAKTVRKTT